MTPTDFEIHKKRIEDMSHIDMARMWRFSPAGNLYFVNEELWKIFEARWNNFGGMTSDISKQIGLG